MEGEEQARFCLEVEAKHQEVRHTSQGMYFLCWQ